MVSFPTHNEWTVDEKWIFFSLSCRFSHTSAHLYAQFQMCHLCDMYKYLWYNDKSRTINYKDVHVSAVPILKQFDSYLQQLSSTEVIYEPSLASSSIFTLCFSLSTGCLEDPLSSYCHSVLWHSFGGTSNSTAVWNLLPSCTLRTPHLSLKSQTKLSIIELVTWPVLIWETI